MKLSILLAGSILTSAIVGNAYAQTCGAQPSCSSLGYNLSSTSGCLGTAVKCPFENKYNCITQSNLSEYSKNSSNWWYKDKGTGLIFQGGKVNVTTNSDMTVYFNKSFSSVPATVILTPYEQPTTILMIRTMLLWLSEYQLLPLKFAMWILMIQVVVKVMSAGLPLVIDCH